MWRIYQRRTRQDDGEESNAFFFQNTRKYEPLKPIVCNLGSMVGSW